MRITRRNTLSVTPSTDLDATEDNPCKVGSRTARDDLLLAPSFTGWALSRRYQMSFDGPRWCGHSGEFVGVVRASRAVTCDSATGRTPKVVLEKLTEGQYKITSTITTPRVSTPEKRKDLYVRRMLRYWWNLSFSTN